MAAGQCSDMYLIDQVIVLDPGYQCGKNGKSSGPRADQDPFEGPGMVLVEDGDGDVHTEHPRLHEQSVSDSGAPSFANLEPMRQPKKRAREVRISTRFLQLKLGPS